MRVALVSCVKSKAASPQAAQDLYVSPLFKKLRRYAELHADSWYVLSAEHGLLRPDELTAPYERTLNKMPVRERTSWAAKVQQQLSATLEPGSEVIVLTGERYREQLVPFLRNRGHIVTIPFEGLSFGRQLQRLTEILAPIENR